MTSRHPSVVLLLVVSVGLFARIPSSAAGKSSSDGGEYEVKAAFLFHFAQFVEWPPETFKDANAPLTYCMVGEDPFRGVLDQILNGKTIGTRPVRVQHLKEIQKIRECQVLFIGGGDKKRRSEEMASANGSAVLTIGETEHFIQEGGMIGFCMEDNKIRFEINLEATEVANLKVSSRLVALARRVVGKAEPRKS